MHSAKKATIRSLILPGWGQAYNQQYWKIPIVVGAVTIPTVTFFNYNKWHQEANNVYNNFVTQIYADKELDMSKIDLLPIEYKNTFNAYYNKNRTTAVNNFLLAVQKQRNIYLKYRDYSVVWLIVLWGLNVVDATVSGHLKHFDVNDDLSFKLNVHPSNPLNYSNNYTLTIIKKLKKY